MNKFKYWINLIIKIAYQYKFKILLKTKQNLSLKDKIKIYQIMKYNNFKKIKK
jgi:hypothetical protein